MRAAWDWDLSRETAAQERDLVGFAADCGFDTLIVREPTPVMAEASEDRGLDLVAVVDDRPSDPFREANSDALQEIHPVEEGILDAIDEYGDDGRSYWRFAHRQYPHVHDTDFLCLESEASLTYLEGRIDEALAVADGVAFDGFGYRNHYACFCDRCEDRRERRAAGTDAGPRDPAVVAACSEATLVEASRRLYDHAKDRGAAPVTNHVWPPFAPNPDYDHRLALDYCTATIAWFYRPAPSLERVAFEAEERARLARGTGTNKFVPFVGVFDDPYHRRSAERIRRELEIGLEHGEGIVLCTLGLAREDPDVKAAVRGALA